MPDISRSFGMKDLGVGLLVSVPHIVSAFLPIIIGAISDRFGKKKMILLFAGIFTVGCTIAGFSGSMLVYLIGAALVGGSHSVCESVSTAVISDTDPGNAARNINISQGLLSAGAVLGPIIMSWLVMIPSISWRHLFMISGGGFLLMIVAIALMHFPVAQKTEKTQKKRNVRLILSGVLLCALVSMTLYVSLEKGIGNFAKSLFLTRLGREDLGAYAISLFWVGITVAHFVLNPKMDRLPKMMAVHFAVCAALFLGLFLSKNAYLSMGLSLVLGFACGPLWPSLVALGTQQAPDHSGTVAGMMSSFGSVGSIVAPLLMGAVSDNFGIHWGFCLMAAFAAIAMTLMLLAKKRK